MSIINRALVPAALLALAACTAGPAPTPTPPEVRLRLTADVAYICPKASPPIALDLDESGYLASLACVEPITCDKVPLRPIAEIRFRWGGTLQLAVADGRVGLFDCDLLLGRRAESLTTVVLPLVTRDPYFVGQSKIRALHTVDLTVSPPDAHYTDLDGRSLHTTLQGLAGTRVPQGCAPGSVLDMDATPGASFAPEGRVLQHELEVRLWNGGSRSVLVTQYDSTRWRVGWGPADPGCPRQ